MRCQFRLKRLMRQAQLLTACYYPLYLKALLDMKNLGNKEEAVAAFYRLEKEGLGKVFEVSNPKALQW